MAGGAWRGQVLITALRPFPEGENKSRERKNEETSPLALLAPARVPAAPPAAVSCSRCSGWVRFQRRREGKLCTTSRQNGSPHPYQRMKTMKQEFV